MFETRSKIFLLFLISILLTATYSADLEPKPQLTRANQITEALSAFPLYFIENKGQVNECVKYHFKMPKGNVYFTPEEIVYQYPTLRLADVYIVIGYYLQHRVEVESYLRQREQLANEVRQQNEARFEPYGVRDRLLARRVEKDSFFTMDG